MILLCNLKIVKNSIVMENIQEALLLLLIGMIMVFIILWLVVGLGNILIKATNKYIADVKEDTGEDSKVSNTDKNPKKIATIVAAVDIATQGLGRIESINKIK